MHLTETEEEINRELKRITKVEDGRAALVGTMGSGKTVLALYTAFQLEDETGRTAFYYSFKNRQADPASGTEGSCRN